MAAPRPNPEGEDDLPILNRVPTPPLHTTFAERKIHPPEFSEFQPRHIRIPSPHAMTHVAWNCDGKRLAAVGIDKVVRVWHPDKSIEVRSASMFSGGHSDDVDYVSWNPTHPDIFCTSSQKDRRIVFWDARQSRHVQAITLKSCPAQTVYTPDGKSLIYTTTNRTTYHLSYGREGEETKDQWHFNNRDPLNVSKVTLNHAGDCIIGSHDNEAAIRIWSFPGLELLVGGMNAHVGGCSAHALDPKGRYLATGGVDTIINLYDTSDWICRRTILCSEYSTNALSFSHDGEYLAIASNGPYIDICATETGESLHRIDSLGAAQTVTWHPTKYIIAYCGQTEKREGAPPPAAWISLFGPDM